jgi:periplasmic protein TonB
MRRDLIIGIILAIAIHVGVAWVSEASKKGPPPRKKDDTKVVQVELKTLPPEDVEPEESEEVPEKIDFMPPMQQDLPQLVTPDSFVIPPQPPPPDSLKLSGAVSIPQGNLTAGFSKVFELKDLDTIPSPTLQVPPNYPADLKRKGVEGFVEVGFIVDENGMVQNAHVLSSSQREFEQAAVLAVAKWKFKPGKKGGKNVRTNMSVPINFHLNGNQK